MKKTSVNNPEKAIITVSFKTAPPTKYESHLRHRNLKDNFILNAF